jgi:hypothetical protein
VNPGQDAGSEVQRADPDEPGSVDYGSDSDDGDDDSRRCGLLDRDMYSLIMGAIIKEYYDGKACEEPFMRC